MGRHEQFTYEGKRALYDWLEMLVDETGQEIELDVIALCCEFTEYESMKDLQNEYPDVETMEELENNTVVLPIEGTDGFIIQNYSYENTQKSAYHIARHSTICRRSIHRNARCTQANARQLYRAHSYARRLRGRTAGKVGNIRREL